MKRRRSTNASKLSMSSLNPTNSDITENQPYEFDEDLDEI